MFGRKSNAQAKIVSDEYPLLGRRAIYRISKRDEGRIDCLSGMNNGVLLGDVFAMMITKVLNDEGLVNGTLFLDGEDTLWLTSIEPGDKPGQYLAAYGR